MEFKQYIIEIIKKNYFVGIDFDIDDSESLQMSGAIDSIGLIKLVGLIEDKFSIKVQDDEFLPENLDSINAIVRFLKKKVIPQHNVCNE